MLRRILSNISHNEILREILVVVCYIFMVIVIILALLMMDAKEISFVYANF